jgi:hypothetical protein
MSTAENLAQFLRENDYAVFIEAEGRISRLQSFFSEYNSKFNPSIDEDTDGIIVLEDSADKWGLELRLYMHCAPDFLKVTTNSNYRGEYQYRINDIELIWDLFELGFRIGLNQT